MTCPRAPGWRAGWRSPSCRRRTFGLSGAAGAPAARGGLERRARSSWSGSSIAALVVLPFGLVALRGRWELLRRNAGLVAVYGVLAVAGAQFCYFSAVAAHAGRPGAADRVHRAGGGRRAGMWLRHGQRPGPLTLRRRRARRPRAGAGARPGLRRRPQPGRRALGAGRDGRRRDVLRDLRRRGQRAAADGAGGRRPGGRRRSRSGWPGWSACCRCDAADAGVDVRRRRRSTGGCRWWCSASSPRPIAYTTGIAAGRRLGSRLASFVALLEVVAGVLFAWLLLDELPRADPAGRRPADPGRRRRRQAGGADHGGRPLAGLARSCATAASVRPGV